MSKRAAYFAYGSNMSAERMRERLPSAIPLGRAKLPNKRLEFNKKSEDGSGKANLADRAGDAVWGVLYEIDPTELDNLDAVEGGYGRMTFDVITDQHSSVEAYVFVSSQLTDDPRPYDWYKALMVKGAREHGLPASYIEYLEQIPTKPEVIKEGCNFI